MSLRARFEQRVVVAVAQRAEERSFNDAPTRLASASLRVLLGSPFAPANAETKGGKKERGRSRIARANTVPEPSMRRVKGICDV